MNKLLSLLLLALAVVSTQGFAISSGIPVMGGAVGGAYVPGNVDVFSTGRYVFGPDPVFSYHEEEERAGLRAFGVSLE